MARIPGYESQATELPVEPRYSRVRADPQAFGAGLGPAIQNAAAGSAGQFAQEFERERHEADTIAVNTFADESAREQAALHARLKQAKGLAAGEGANDVLVDFEGVRDRILGKAKNEDQRRHFQLRWAAQRTQLEKEAAAHVIEQADLLDKATQESGVARQNTRIVADPFGATKDFFEPDPMKSPIAMLNGQLQDYVVRTTGNPAEAANAVRKVRENQALLIAKSLLAKAHQTGYQPVRDFLTQASGELGPHLPGLEAEVDARVGATRAITSAAEAARRALGENGLVNPVQASQYLDADVAGLPADDQRRAREELNHRIALYRHDAEQKTATIFDRAKQILQDGDLGTDTSAWTNPDTWDARGGEPAELARLLRRTKSVLGGRDAWHILRGWYKAHNLESAQGHQIATPEQTAYWSYLTTMIHKGELDKLPAETFVQQWLLARDSNKEPRVTAQDFRDLQKTFADRQASKAGQAMPRDAADQLLVLKTMETMGFERPTSGRRGSKPLDPKDIPLDSTFGAVHLEVTSEFQTWRKAHPEATDAEAVQGLKDIVRAKKAEQVKKPGVFGGTKAFGAEVRQRESLQPVREEFQAVDAQGDVIRLPEAKVVEQPRAIPAQVRDSTGSLVDPRKEIRSHFLQKYHREPTEPEVLEFYNANVQRKVFR